MVSRGLHGVDVRLDRIEGMLDDIVRRERALKRRLESLMATVAELQASVAAVGTDVAKLGTDSDEILTELKALRDGAGAGGINPSDLDPIIASLTAVHDSATATAAKLEAAAVPVTPVPPPTARP